MNKKDLFFIFLLSFGVRIIFFMMFLSHGNNSLNGDSGLYELLAKNIANGFGFVGADGAANFYRVPGYPFFLSFCYRVGFLKDLFHMLPGVFIPVLIYCLSYILFPRKRFVALFASIASCVHVGFAVYSGLILSDCFFVFLFLSFLIVFFWALKSWHMWGFFGAGIVLGLSSLVRPMGTGIVVVVSLVTLCLCRDIRVTLRTIGLIFLGWLCVVGGWLLRNFLLTGFIFFHTLPGSHFLNYFLVPVTSMVHSISVDEAKGLVYGEYAREIREKEKIVSRPLAEIEKVNVVKKLALKCLLSYPFYSCRFFIGNMLKTCTSFYSAELLLIDAGGLSFVSERWSLMGMIKRYVNPVVKDSRMRFFIWWEFAFNIFLLFGVLGFIIVSLYTRRDFSVLISFLWFALFFVALSFGCGYARFRLPIESFLIIMSCKFWLDTVLKREKCEAG